MKPYGIHLIRLTAVVAVSVVFVGCTYTLKSNDVFLQTGSPLKGIPKKTFAFKDFRDARGSTIRDPYMIARAGSHKFKLDQPAATFVFTVIRKELERNGHTCIAYSAQSKSDFIIEGSLYKLEVHGEGAGVYRSAKAAVKLTVTPVPPKEELLIKAYEGEGSVKAMYISKMWKENLTQAVLAMVKQISTDPELIAFLEK